MGVDRKEIERLGEQIAADIAHLDAALHQVLAKIRAFDEAGGWYAQGFRSCAQWLSWRVGWTMTTARSRVRVAARLPALPLIDEAFRLGELSYSKVRAITRVATPAIESVLLEQARLTTGEQLELICRKYASVQRHDVDVRPEDDKERRHVRRRDLADGMVSIEAVLHPEEAAVVWAALERVAAERCREREAAVDGSAGTPAAAFAGADGSAGTPAAAFAGGDGSAGTPAAAFAGADGSAGPRTGVAVAAEDSAAGTAGGDAVTASAGSAGTPAAHRIADDLSRRVKKTPAFDRANALIEIAQGVVRGDRPERTPYEIVVTTAAETLQGTSAPEPDDVACCADGACISAEAARRLSCDAGIIAVFEDPAGTAVSVGRKTRSIPGAMKRALLRRDRTCRFPGCRTRVFLEGHHILHWAHGGETKLSNLVACCDYHHRFVHEYGYRVAMTDVGSIHFTDAEGRPVHEAPAPVLVQDRGWPTIARRTSDLGIHPDTRETWDGSKVDYGFLIEHIVRAEDGSEAEFFRAGRRS